MIFLPSGSKGKRGLQKARNRLEKIEHKMTSIAIPEDNMGFYLEFQNIDYKNLDLKHEKEPLGSPRPIYPYEYWEKDHLAGEAVLDLSAQDISCKIIAPLLQQIIDMLQLHYLNIDAETIQAKLRTAGLLHIVKASAFGAHKTKVSLQRLIESDLLRTWLHGTGNTLVHLIVSPDFQNSDLEYLCDKIIGRISPEASFDLAITVDVTKENCIEIHLISTNAYLSCEWEDYQKEYTWIMSRKSWLGKHIY